jgi:hypothetical protein
MERFELADSLENLVIFSSVSREPIIKALVSLLRSGGEGAYSAACALARELYPRGADLTQQVLAMALEDDNYYIRAKAAGRETPPEHGRQLARELEVLGECAAISSEDAANMLGITRAIPEWRAEKVDFLEEYAVQLGRIDKKGYGIFAKHHVFTLSAGGELVPVENPDPQRLSELYGYEAEREKVIGNTRALLAGKRANNVLLYGDAGTGKSSCVKAIANEFAGEGLRLIQIEKGDIAAIPALMDRLAGNPLKFILFIDDLSFTSNDSSFTAMKTVLEGSVTSRAGNTVVYATSNRRHLVKESFQARQGDEVHLNDTLEEVSSLSARFGLTVTFTKPDKALFSEVVLSLAKQYGLQEDEHKLLIGAEAYALRAGGRSPRLARQYIEYKIAESLDDIRQNP